MKGGTFFYKLWGKKKLVMNVHLGAVTRPGGHVLKMEYKP